MPGYNPFPIPDLSLGIIGTDNDAAQKRLDAAHELIQTSSAVEDRFYWDLLIEHGGNIKAVLQDPRLDDELSDLLYLQGGTIERPGPSGEIICEHTMGDRYEPSGRYILARAHTQIVRDATGGLGMEQAIRAEPADALTLGITGTDPASTQRRFELAQALQQEHVAHSGKLFSDPGTGLEDPTPPAPFGLRLLLEHEGDVAAVLEDPTFTEELATQLQLNGWREEYYNDFDSLVSRWNPPTLHTPEGQAVMAEERAKIAAAAGIENPIPAPPVAGSTLGAEPQGPVSAPRQERPTRHAPERLPSDPIYYVGPSAGPGLSV